MKTVLIIVTGFLFFILLAGAGRATDTFQVSSPDFADNAGIPKKYTCNGKDVSPALEFKNIPAKAKSMVLTVTDPDAPEGTWTHWVVYNITPDTVKVDEDSNPGIEGLSDFGKSDYGGPCPPDDKLHHYVFRVYALDELIKVNEAPSLGEVDKAMQGHIVEKTELIGTYQK